MTLMLRQPPKAQVSFCNGEARCGPSVLLEYVAKFNWAKALACPIGATRIQNQLKWPNFPAWQSNCDSTEVESPTHCAPGALSELYPTSRKLLRSLQLPKVFTKDNLFKMNVNMDFMELDPETGLPRFDQLAHGLNEPISVNGFYGLDPSNGLFEGGANLQFGPISFESAARSFWPLFNCLEVTLTMKASPNSLMAILPIMLSNLIIFTILPFLFKTSFVPI